MPLIENVTPVLSVRSLAESILFYGNILGFHPEWGGEPGSKICSVARDGKSIMLSEVVEGYSKSCVWIGLDDGVFHEIRNHPKVNVVLEPRNMPWAYEMKIEDLDGNILWLGTEPRQ